MTDQKHTKELLPCPFCSGQGRLQSKMREGYEDHALDQDAYAYYVRCISCACDGPWFKNEGSAIRSWNQRPQITAITKQRDELRDALETLLNACKALPATDGRVVGLIHLFSKCENALTKTKESM